MVTGTVRRALPTLLALALLASSPAGCVIVSTGSTGPRVDGGPGDAGLDAPRPDAGEPFDAGAGICDRHQVLRSIASGVVLPTYRTFDARAAELESAVTAYATSLSDADRAAAQEAWRRAMDVWEEAELMQIGPAAMTMTATGGALGGMDLRDEIYSWDFTNRCFIDRETVSQSYLDVDAFAAQPVNVRGLDALEYLLFFAGPENGCSSSHAINTSGSWAALSSSGALPSQRAAYARTLAVLVRRSASRLVSLWEPGGGDFAGQLARGDGAYPDLIEAMNAVSDALILYADKEIKDMKLAGPAAISMACVGESCPELLESRWAERNREHLLANLRGVRAVVLGGATSEGDGLDDLLVCHGCAATARALVSAIDAAIAAVEALPPITAASLASELDALAVVHTDVKAITDLLKTEFVTCLDLDLPVEAGTDND